MILAVPLGIIAGLVARGRIDGLSELRLRWAWLALAGLLVQAFLFSDTGFAFAGGAAPAIYVASTAAVLVTVLANLRLAGMAVVALGSLSNLAAIVTNGGSMPADPGALALAGLPVEDHNNSVVAAEPALRFLTDIFAIPDGLPLANVFSVGDVLIAVGIIWLIAGSMRAAAKVPTGAGAMEAQAG